MEEVNARLLESYKRINAQANCILRMLQAGAAEGAP